MHPSAVWLMDCLPDEAVEKSVSGGLRRGPRRRRFADQARAAKAPAEAAGGPGRLRAIGQLAARLRTGKWRSQFGVHGFEKARDATANFSILAGQLHSRGHQPASAPAIGSGRAV